MMKASDAKELLRGRIADYFSGYEVVFANQSRMAKPSIPLIVIRYGNVKRTRVPEYSTEDGITKGKYQARISVTIDLFTNGRPITDGSGNVLAYENTAMDEMLAFCDYINGQETTEWCFINKLSILVEGEAQDLTGAVNDNNYEYRARQEMYLNYTHDAGTDDTITTNFSEVIMTEG